MRPVIGITPDEGMTNGRTGRPSLPRYELKRAYADAVAAAGGLPIVLPYLTDEADLESALQLVKGVVVTGGAFDVDPALFGEDPHPRLGALNAGRTRFEQQLMTRALAKGLPVLGICGGMQLLNVIRGGTLVQDLASQRPEAASHEQPHDPRESAHAVRVEKNSLLGRVSGERLNVNTTHHQAVKALGQGLVATGVAPDGIVEAIEDPSRPFVVGVQWHPELLDDEASRALFKAFVAAAHG